MLWYVNCTGMSVGGEFGPSTGRLVEVNESYETRVRMNTRAMPPVAGILASTVAFLAFVFGAALLYQNEKILGWALVIAAVILVAIPVFWTIKNRW